MCFSTYSKYSNSADGDIQEKSAKWAIKLNTADVTGGASYDFSIDNIELSENEDVLEGNIAPGMTGYFDIMIDPSGTEVYVRYDFTIDTTDIAGTGIEISSISELGESELLQTAENTYTGLISIDEIKSGKVHTIRVQVAWPDEESNNQVDYQTGSIANNVIQFPITVKTSQYLGETIQSYNN